MTTATQSRASSTGADIFERYTSVEPGYHKKRCSVCSTAYDYTDPCEYCREDLPGLLINLRAQQDRIIAGIAADTLALDTAINAANDEELIRYQRLLAARAAIGYDSDRLVAFSARYIASQKLQDGLGAIVRAMAALDTRPARENALDGLQRAISVVELAIEELKESE